LNFGFSAIEENEANLSQLKSESLRSLDVKKDPTIYPPKPASARTPNQTSRATQMTNYSKKWLPNVEILPHVIRFPQLPIRRHVQESSYCTSPFPDERTISAKLSQRDQMSRSTRRSTKKVTIQEPNLSRVDDSRTDEHIKREVNLV
jgi:hypothetical protein